MKRKQKIPLLTTKRFNKLLQDNPDLSERIEQTRQMLLHPERVRKVVEDILSTPKVKKQLEDAYLLDKKPDYIG